MEKGRLEAFTDGVIAIIITIMVLEMKVPSGTDRTAILAALPVFLAYALSYVNVGLFWNNHHHMLAITECINGRVLWANLFLLFWMSLIPFVIRWIDEVWNATSGLAAAPTAAYGVVLSCASIGYLLLERAIIACNGPDSKLAKLVGSDAKARISLALYVIAIPAAFLRPSMAIALYVANALIWAVPDRRIESGV
jgi:uncharacterized membrane protein